jgi:hypothetical protein
MTALRTLVAAAALAVAGFATSANAATTGPNLGKTLVKPNIKLHLCFPHYERKIIFRHHVRYLVVYYVDRFCHKKIVRVIRLGHHYAAR